MLEQDKNLSNREVKSSVLVVGGKYSVTLGIEWFWGNTVGKLLLLVFEDGIDDK